MTIDLDGRDFLHRILRCILRFDLARHGEANANLYNCKSFASKRVQTDNFRKSNISLVLQLRSVHIDKYRCSHAVMQVHDSTYCYMYAKIQ